MDPTERDSGLMSAPESELLHELYRLREALLTERAKSMRLALELAKVQRAAMSRATA
jgi:hypothetical protein